MSPKFASAVDPVFQQVLGILEQIETGNEPDPSIVQSRIDAVLDRGERKLGVTQDWVLAKYAIVAWVDEVLIDNPWMGREWWTSNCLEVRYYRERHSFERFYVEATHASAGGNRDALEVFYLAVVLGFRGFYSASPLPDKIQTVNETIEMPGSLGAWTRQMAASIHLGQGMPPVYAQPVEGDGAPPLRGRFELLGALLWFVVLLFITGILGWHLLSDIIGRATLSTV